jgi:hypothetical protein
MATAPLITYLLLDAQYDPVFDPSNSLIDAQAVQQAILTRLRLFLGEWWENMNLGLPVFQSILGQLGSARFQAATNLAIQQQIEGVPYVASVTSISSSFDDGRFSFSATVQTSFGPVAITNLPANSASLDT